MGIRCQPTDVSRLTQLLVRFGCEQALFPPPMYTPTAWYAEDPHADSVDELGAEQASKPRPVYTPPEAWAGRAVAGRLATCGRRGAWRPRSDRRPSARSTKLGSLAQVADTRSP